MTTAAEHLADEIAEAVYAAGAQDPVSEVDVRHEPPVHRVELAGADGQTYFAVVLAEADYEARFGPKAQP